MTQTTQALEIEPMQRPPRDTLQPTIGLPFKIPLTTAYSDARSTYTVADFLVGAIDRGSRRERCGANFVKLTHETLVATNRRSNGAERSFAKNS